MEKKKKDSPLKFYAKYSSLALQMIVIVVVGAFGGRELDIWLQLGFPVFTLIGTVIAVVGSIVYAVRGLFNDH